MENNHFKPTLQHEFTSIRISQLPDFGLLKKQCIAFGESIPQPVDGINQIAGYESSYLHKIQQLKLDIPTPVQSHLWPILFRGRSATCISAPKSGKTLSYLIPALSDSQFKDNDPNQLIYGDEGPKVVVVCSGLNKVYEIREQIYSILNSRNSNRIILLTKDNEKSVSTNILNGCDLLISTPGPLQRFIDNGCVRFDICSLLVFDDADKSFTIQPELVQSIVLAYLKSYKKRLNIADDLNSLLTAPMLILADCWTKEVKNFATQYMKNSIQIFGDLFEAAIAHDLNYHVKFIPQESERIKSCADLIHSLLCRGKLNRIAIVCSNDEESKQVFKTMVDLDVVPVIIDSSKFNYEIPKLIEMSKSHPRAITIITDDKIKEFPQLNHIDTLVHFSMPDHTDIFRSRFMLMSMLIRQKDESINTHFLLSSINGNHAHFLCQSLRRVSPIPLQLDKLKNVSQRPLCDYFLAYSYCPFKSTFCLNRHQFKLSDPVNKFLPVDGQIRFEITHIINANQFYLRLIEYRDSKSQQGEWIKYNYQYNVIKDQLQALKDQDSPIEDSVPIIGKIYGLIVMGIVHRVKVIENLGQLTNKETNMTIDDQTPFQLEVNFIDFGYHSKALSNQLICLPKHLRDYQPLAIRSFILGIKPIDNEIEWTHKPAESLTNFLREHRNLVATSWVKMQRKSIFWLDNMKIIQNLKHLKRNVVSWSPECDLIDSCLAAKNDQYFPKVNTNHHSLYLKWSNHRLWQSASRAFLNDQFQLTYLSHFVDFNTFYVVKQSDFKCLENLEKDLSKLQLTPMKAFIENCLGIGIVENSGSKSFSRIKVIQHLPEEKLVEVFFLDWGETYKIPEKFCFTIDEKFIKRLPFQAIKCSLVGVEGNVDPNTIYDLTRTSDELFKHILLEKIDGTKETSYSVRVYYETHEENDQTYFMRLSKWLVDNGHGVYTDQDEDKKEIHIGMPNGKTDIDDSEDSEDEVTRGERLCAQNLLDSVSDGMRQFLIENIKPDPVQFDPNKISKRAKMLLTLKRLKEEEEKKRKEELRINENEDSDNDWQSTGRDEPPNGRTDYSNVLPYDPTSSEGSELESDLEDFGHDAI